MKKYSLILNNKPKIDNYEENLIGLVPYNHLNNFQRINFSILKKSEILKRYNDCKLIFEKILPEITTVLNNLHNTKLSQRAWHIILGTWLSDYILIFYKIYSQMNYIKDNYDLEKIYSLDYKNFDFSVSDTYSFRMASSKDDQWFYLLSSKLYHYFNKDLKFSYGQASRQTLIEDIYYKNNNTFSKNSRFLFKIQNYLIKKFFNYNTKAFISKTALPYFYEKKLQFKVDKLIIDWPEIDLIYSKKNKDLRSKITLEAKESFSKFENFLRINLKEFLPKFSVENFHEIKKIANSKSYPQTPKFIFTSMLYAYDESFKIYAALQTEKKVPYYVGQHGQNYFTQIGQKFLPELDFSDNFITWGFNRRKLKGYFNFKTIGKSYKFKNDGNLIIFPLVGYVYSYIAF